MSLYSALGNGVGGMMAQSSVIGSVSDNLANAQTVGFKRTDTRFEALVSEKKNNTSYNGSGVKARPFYQNDLQGSLLQSQVSTYTSISGDGFFNVVRGTIGDNGVLTANSEQYYTRRGDFDLSRSVDTLDTDGNIVSSRGGYVVNGAGYYLMGYAINEVTGVASTTAAPMEVASLRSDPVATTQASFYANVPAGTASGDTFPSTTVKIYDSNGDEHDVVFTWSKTATLNQWSLNVSIADSTTPLNRDLLFDFNGPPAGTPSALASSTGSGSAFTITSPTTAGSPLSASVDIGFADADNQTITFNFGQYLNGAGVTQFAANDVQVTSTDQNGLPPGAFESLQIDGDGFVILNYSSGLSRRVFQIPVAHFESPNNLERSSGGAFISTTESGSASLFAAGESGTGKIVSNALEGSNVDLGSEFTKLIESQRVYSANSKSVETANQMISDLALLAR